MADRLQPDISYIEGHSANYWNAIEAVFGKYWILIDDETHGRMVYSFAPEDSVAEDGKPEQDLDAEAYLHIIYGGSGVLISEARKMCDLAYSDYVGMRLDVGPRRRAYVSDTIWRLLKERDDAEGILSDAEVCESAAWDARDLRQNLIPRSIDTAHAEMIASYGRDLACLGWLGGNPICVADSPDPADQAEQDNIRRGLVGTQCVLQSTADDPMEFLFKYVSARGFLTFREKQL